MGVRGLKSFAEENRRELFSSEVLNGRTIIIDGYNLIHELYYSCCLAETAYGGDYDVFAQSVDDLLARFSAANVKLYVVFDGTTDLDDSKLQTLLRRAKERLHLVGLSQHRKRAKILPILAFQTCVNKLTQYSIPYCVCDHEADQDIACIGAQWNCPIVSNDSDLLLYDLPAGVILIDDLRLKLTLSEPLKEEWHVSVYHVSRLKSLYHIEDQRILSLLSVICSNDHVCSDLLLKLRQELNTKAKVKELDSYLKWICQFKSVDKLKERLLTYSQPKDRERLDQAINDMMQYYSIPPEGSYLISYLENQKFWHLVEHPLKKQLPQWFWSRVRAAKISKDIAEVVFFKRRILSTQSEKLNSPSAWNCSQCIRIAIYRILSVSVSDRITDVKEYTRTGKQLTHSNIPVGDTETSLSLEHISDMSDSEKVAAFINVLGLTSSLKTNACLDSVADRLLLSIIVYWINNTNPAVSQIHLLSLLMCYVTLKHVRECDGTATASLPKTPTKCTVLSPLKYAQSPIRDQNHKDGVCFDTVHVFSQFQSILSDSFDLLGLLCIEHTLLVHEIFSGRYVYNLCLELKTEPNPVEYCLELLGTKFAGYLQMWYNSVETSCDKSRLAPAKAEQIQKNDQKVKGKKKAPKMVKAVDLKPTCSSDSDSDSDSNDYLLNNRFAMLAIKKR